MKLEDVSIAYKYCIFSNKYRTSNKRFPLVSATSQNAALIRNLTKI